MTSPTPSDRLALAMCRAFNGLAIGDQPYCSTLCPECREQSAVIATELAAILREHHGDASHVADWLDEQVADWLDVVAENA